MTNPITFLDDVLGGFFAPPKQRRKQDPGYGRLYRWCKKNGFSYQRDMSYWDFDDDRIGTIGMNEGGNDFDSVLEIARKRIATGNPEATLWDQEEQR